ncbi:hypothetical protein SLEP1_g53225 [Rubroshorea leprosula]|uniref:F-box domain-containing protein n=1 Tax=Rubroshorea leprosula TaxID=152421 RepID=A0AAV5MBL2_9ROSI|nr:hypothetical protein SLEP1_g53225 [Rubroshorea leprosula]
MIILNACQALYGDCNPFSPSTSGKTPATPPNPNPKIKSRRTNFTSEISTTICNSPSFTPKRRKKNPVTNPQQTQFPPDLIEVILLRLGVKSLLRFKCLSKQWFFLLSNQQFITRHLKIQTSICTHQEFIVQSSNDSDFAIGTRNANADKILFLLLETNYLQVQPSEKIASFLGHCNGLVSAHLFCKETDRSSIVVWNPSTKEQRRFPIPQCRQKNFERFGFGYDSISDDYKLVVATSALSGRKLDKVQCLSLKTGLWKTTQPDAGYLFDLSGAATESKHVNGRIYWLIDRERRPDCGIATFDLATDRMEEEESLSWILSNDFKIYAALELIGDSLCLVVSPDEVTYDMWMMEENLVTHAKFWTKLFRVQSTDGNFNAPLDDETNRDVMSPVCFTRNNKVLIFWHDRHEYALYDPNDQSVNKVAEFGNPIVRSWPVSPCVESLVTLGR